MANDPQTTDPWHPIETVPSTGTVIVRGADGIERRFMGGWIEWIDGKPVIPKEWRYMVEDGVSNE